MNEFLRRLRDLMEQMHQLNYTARRRTTTLDRFMRVNSAESIFPNISTMNVDEFVRKFGIDEANQEEITGRIAPIIATAEAQSRNFRSNVMDAVTRGMADAARKGLEGDYRAYAREALRPAIKELHHIEAEVNTAGAALDRAGSLESARMAGVEWFRFVGPATNPRKFCAEHVGKIFHISEIESMNNGQGLSVLYYMGGYHCRHQWVAVDEETAAKERPRQPRLFNKSDIKPGVPARTTPPPDVRDPLTKLNWNNKRGRVTADADIKQFIKKNFKGTSLANGSLEGALRLTGAPDGANFTVFKSGTSLRVEIQHPWYESFQRSITVDNRQRLLVYNDVMVLKGEKNTSKVADRAPQGVGLRTLAAQVREGRRLNVASIETFAAGDKGSTKYNGYYTWFRFGYNAPLTSLDLRNIKTMLDSKVGSSLSDDEKAKFRAANTVRDVFDISKFARDFWKEVACGRHASFDPKIGSRNSKALQNYLDETGVKL